MAELTDILDIPRRLALYGSDKLNCDDSRLQRFLSTLLAGPFPIAVETNFALSLIERGISLPEAAISPDPSSDADIALSIGGDGAFLRAVQQIGRPAIPLLGINAGHLGYLSNYSIDEAPEIISDLLSRRLIRERRATLRVSFPGMDADLWPYALNEIAILKEDTASMITVNTSLDGNFLADYLCDGLLISTPTGSTAYNLSVGGPILAPTLDAFVISPIAPHTLTLRPLAISSSSAIVAVTTSRAPYFRLSIDGSSFRLPCGSTLTIEKGDFSLTALRRPGSDFAATLRAKLHWGQR